MQRFPSADEMTDPKLKTFEGSHILVVDDEKTNVMVVQRALQIAGYDVVGAGSAEKARACIKQQMPDLILLDISMPEVSGLEFLTELRGQPNTSRVPVILVSALTDTETIVTGLQTGANDYIMKPVEMPVLLARVQTQLSVAERARILEMQAGTLAKLAQTDPLTGLINRRGFVEIYTSEVSRARRYKRSRVVAMMDLDHFKNINDRYGHAGGDAVLRSFASTARAALRTHDVICRYGGEEFCVLMPETKIHGAARVAERARAAIEKMKVMHEGEPIASTVSIGVASAFEEGGDDCTEEALLERADKALYRAKAAGRNCVVSYSPEEDLKKPLS